MIWYWNFCICLHVLIILHFNNSREHWNGFTCYNLISQKDTIYLNLVIIFISQTLSRILNFILFFVTYCLQFRSKTIRPRQLLCFGMLLFKCGICFIAWFLSFALCPHLVSRAKWNLNESTESSQWIGWRSSFLSSWYLQECQVPPDWQVDGCPMCSCQG